jgi:hypothetical protein
VVNRRETRFSVIITPVVPRVVHSLANPDPCPSPHAVLGRCGQAKLSIDQSDCPLRPWTSVTFNNGEKLLTCPMSATVADTPMLAYPQERRWPRYKIDVPVRAVIHKQDRTLIRDARGMEMSEGGMCLSAGVELGIGDEIEVEFTPPYSGEPIRVRRTFAEATFS